MKSSGMWTALFNLLQESGCAGSDSGPARLRTFFRAIPKSPQKAGIAMDQTSDDYLYESITANPDTVAVHAGFPNPATDRRRMPLSLDTLLIAHPISTFLFRIRGSGWEDRGVFDGDIALIDRACDPRPDDTVVWWDETNEFRLARRQQARRQQVWGVVTAIIHPVRKEWPPDESLQAANEKIPL